jgi:hypothetical protein
MSARKYILKIPRKTVIRPTPQTDISRISRLIRAGAKRLLKQVPLSADFFLSADSDIAEANLAVHIASAFIKETRHLVWAEAPLLVPGKMKLGRFDLSIDLDYKHSSHPELLRVEVKRITSGEENKKAGEIVCDFWRLKSWEDPWGKLRSQEQRYGAVGIIIPETCDKLGDIPKPSFSDWWFKRGVGSAPAVYKQKVLSQLRLILRYASIVNLVSAPPPWHGLRKFIVLYAVFDFRKIKALSRSKPCGLGHTAASL